MHKKLFVAFLLFLFFLSLLTFDTPHVEAAAMSGNTVGTTTTTTATRHGYGRKTYIWNNSALVFYSDGTNAVMRSSWNGSTWSSATTIRATVTEGYYFYVWVDNATSKLHYIFNDEVAASAIYYRRGTLSGSGTSVAVAWDGAEVAAIAGAAGKTYYPCGVMADSTGRAFIVFGNRSTAANAAPMVDRQSAVGPGWSSSPGYPMQLNTSTVDDIPSISMIGFASGGRMGFFWSYGSNTTKLQQRLLHSSTTWTAVANVSADTTYDNLPFSVAVEGSTTYGNVHFSYVNGSGYTKYGKVHYYSLSGYTLATEQDIVSGITTPTISVTSDGASIRIFRTSGSSLMIFQKVNSLFSGYVLAVESGTIRDDSVQVAPMQQSGKFGVAYTISGYVKFILLPSTYWFRMNGPYMEEDMSAGDSVTVIAYGEDFASAPFTMNDDLIYYADALPSFFRFNYTDPREYWIEPSEGNSTIYAFQAETTTYVISFLDLGGVLPTYPYVNAKQYINGSLMTVEKRKVDSEFKVTLNLIQTDKYTIVLEGSSTSYTFGDLQMTATQTITLTLRGVDFPKETLLTYKYVRIYGLRSFASPTGTISITYQDTLNQTTNVAILIKYDNGTIAYSTTQTTSTFVVNWASAANNTNYQVQATINHQRYGSYGWRQYFPRTFSNNPWVLGWLGSIGFDLNMLIGAFIVVVVGGSFSMLNPAIGAFLATCTAAILTVMGFFPVAPGFLLAAFCFSIMLAIVWARRRVSYG